MVFIEQPKEFDKSTIDLVARKLELAPDYIAWLLSVGNKEALKEYNAAQQIQKAEEHFTWQCQGCGAVLWSNQNEHCPNCG